MFIKLFIIALLVFFIIDMLWLGLVAKKFYDKHLGFIMKAEVNWIAAVIFYMIFIIGILLFVIVPAVNSKSWTYALLYGALFGFVSYSTYDLTNLATLKDWPLTVTIVDLIWGTVLSASVSVITYFVYMGIFAGA